MASIAAISPAYRESGTSGFVTDFKFGNRFRMPIASIVIVVVAFTQGHAPY